MTDLQSEFKLPPVYQLGYVVKDIEPVTKYYESTFGIGPFSPPMDVDMTGAILRGKPISTQIRVTFAQSGSVQVELIQPLEGESLYTEFLAKNGDGIHHLAFEVEDLPVWRAEFAKRGLEPIYYQDMGFMEFAYFDTSDFGGLMVELIDWRKSKPKL